MYTHTNTHIHIPWVRGCVGAWVCAFRERQTDTHTHNTHTHSLTLTLTLKHAT